MKQNIQTKLEAKEPIRHNPILAGRLGKFIPSGIIDLDASELVSQVDTESPTYYCPEGFSMRVSYMMSALSILLVSPRQFRTPCGTEYSCAECPLKPLQE